MELPSDQEASGRSLGHEELMSLAEVIASGTLTSTKGSAVKRLERDFAAMLGVKHVYACSSGTAAIHAAIAALDPEPGDEFVTSSITDMGALTPILYQGAVPAFAEVDPLTWNITAETIRPCLSERTRGIIVTHLFGNPCDMEDIMALADAYGIPLIEDCAQSFLARHQGRLAGTFGSIACFSTQQGKHITTGEGGLVATNDDGLARRMNLFINKGWGYGDAEPDHLFLSLNYRASELQGAVAAAQLTKLEASVGNRIAAARLLDNKLVHFPGVEAPLVHEGNLHTYWKYCLRVDDQIVRGGAAALGARLKARHIACAPRYIQKPAFRCRIFQEQKTLGRSRFPFTLARPEVLVYDNFPQTLAALHHALVLPWNENYRQEHIDYIAQTIAESLEDLTS